MPNSHGFLHSLMKPFKFGSSKERSVEEELERIAAQEPKIFSYQTLVVATNNFHSDHKLGEGGFGRVYKGKLDDGREIAVRRLLNNSRPANEEFMNEVKVLAGLQHRNVVKLLDYGSRGEEKLLVYEYVPRGSLDNFLFDSHHREQLDWKRRLDIITGIAKGLLYLHEGSHNCIIHRDIKPSSILLDDKWMPKISSFCLSRLLIDCESRTDRIVGTYGYMAPEYMMYGHSSMKVDVFSYGVLVLELISGQKNSSFIHEGDVHNLLDWAYKLYKENRSLEFIDPTLPDPIVNEQVTNCIVIGLLCVQDAPDSRPSMDRVLSMLTGNQSLMGIQFVRERPFTSTSSISSGCDDEVSLAEQYDGVEELVNLRPELFPDLVMCSPSNSNQIMEEDLHSNSFRVPTQDGREGHEDDTLKKKVDAQNWQRFSYETLHDATNGFASQNVLGQGGFGIVYKGKLDDGREIAVKKSSNMSERQQEAFTREVELLSSVKHPNVVKLFGYCADDNEFLLVYEYVPHKSLNKLLFGPSGREQELDWTRTYVIIRDIARGLSYLHGNPQNCIIHRDIKPENILLDHRWVPKISDFGISRLFEEDQTHVYTRPVGTWGYMAPEYLDHTRVSVKTDVYSFGVMVLELVSGRRYSFMPPQEDNAIGLLDWAYKLLKEGRMLEIMDPALANTAVTEQVKKCIKMGLLCTQGHPDPRPDMEHCVSMLGGHQDHTEISIARPGIFGYRGLYSGPLSVDEHWGMDGSSSSSQIMSEGPYI